MEEISEHGAVPAVMDRSFPAPTAGGTTAEDLPPWYAIQTRSRFEKKLASQLREKGVIIYLPLISAIHRWSDRRKMVEEPLFSGYAFARVHLPSASKLAVMQTPGFVRFVGCGGEAVPISEAEIANIRLLLDSKVGFHPYPFLHAGQGVRVRGGCLDGLEGVLVTDRPDPGMVVSIKLIQRSLIVQIKGYQLEPIPLKRGALM